MYIRKGFAISACCSVLGLVLLASGLVMIFYVPLQTKSEISKRIALKNGSTSYNSWVDPPVPVYMQFWMFDVVNPDEIIEGAKPKVVQKGPYTYREIRIKQNLTFSEDGTELNYTMPKSYVFVPHLSVGPENDTFTGINLPLLGMADGLQYELSGRLKSGISFLLTLFGEQLFQKKTVKEFLWGYKDSFFGRVKSLLNSLGMHKEAEQIPDIMGLFTGPKANGSNDGVWTIFTGTDNILKFNRIKEWNGKSSVTTWGDQYANKINGTDGSMWHPMLTKDDRVYMFSSDVCRSVDAKYDHSVTIKGLDMYRFIVSDSVFANYTEEPNNLMFCTPDFKNHSCLPAGVLNMSACTGGPIIMSLPHFSLADPSVINAIDGMHPDPVNLNTWLDIEPMTGAVLHAARRMQFNAYIQPLDALSDTHNINKTIFPILWLNETAMIGDATAAQLKHLMYPLKVINVAQYVLVVVGSILLLTAALLLGLYCIQRKRFDVGLSVQSETEPITWDNGS